MISTKVGRIGVIQGLPADSGPKSFSINHEDGVESPPCFEGSLTSVDHTNVLTGVIAKQWFPFGPDAAVEGYCGSQVSFDYRVPVLDEPATVMIAVTSLESSQGETYALQIQNATGGTFEIGVSGDMRTLAHNASAQDIEVALRDVFTSNLVFVVQFDVGGASQISFHPDLGEVGLLFDCDSMEGDPEEGELICYLTQEHSYQPSVFSFLTRSGVYITEGPSEDWTNFNYLSPTLAELVVAIQAQRGSSGQEVLIQVDNVEVLPQYNVVGHPPQSFAGIIHEIHHRFQLAQAFGYGPLFANIPTKRLHLSGSGGVPVWSLQADVIYSAKRIMTLTLTGHQNGLPDVELPMKSFQHHVRVATPAYMACVVPDSARWMEMVTTRPNGQLVVRMGYELPNGSRQLEEIARANFQSVRIDRGPFSDSLTLVGDRHTSPPPPKDWNVSGVSSYALQADGRSRIMAPVDMFLRPGDTCIYGPEPSDRLVVDLIQYYVQAKPPSSRMEVVGMGAG